jgi:hypothetical protein
VRSGAYRLYEVCTDLKSAMGKTRLSITPDVIKRALAMAAASVDSVAYEDWNDSDQKYLTLRQRGKSVTWLVRAYNSSRKIGSATGQHKSADYLGVREAKEKAKAVYGEIGREQGANPEPGPGWTWSDLSREFQASLREHRVSATGRVKPPSKGTMADVRLVFAKAPIAKLGRKRLVDLTFLDVLKAIKTVHAAHGHRSACKTTAYVRSALTWALSKRGEESGLHATMPWWVALKPPDPTGAEIVKMQARQKKLVAAKVGFTVEHLGALLVEHEEFCRGRRAEEKIGPGVRWGLWWVAFTGNRRFSTVALERERLHQTDEFGREGWGRATWPPEMMKGKSEFWLPLPPEVLSIANGSVQDWTQLVRNQHGEISSRWVFASTRRWGRDPSNEDVATYPNSLNAHLRAMRGDKKGFNKGVNRLEDLPWFSLHLVRSVAGNFLDNCEGVPKSGISAMLAHADDEKDDRLAPTTKAFYVQNQLMTEKSDAMQAWSQALIRSFEKAGGKLPEPRETFRPSKLKDSALGMIVQ